MSFYIVIYGSLGMSAFWEIVEKIVKIFEICRFFSGGRWDWIWVTFLSVFWDDFGSSWAPKSEKRRSRNSDEKSLKKSSAVNSGRFRPRGGVPLNNPHSSPGHHDKDP